MLTFPQLLRRVPRHSLLLIGLAGLGMVYEWGPFNEIVVTKVGVANYLNEGSPWRTGLVVALVVTITQLVLGLISGTALRSSDLFRQYIAQRFDLSGPASTQRRLRRWWFAVVLGATAVAGYYLLATPERRSWPQMVAVVTEAALAAGSATFVVGFGATSLAGLLTDHGHGTAADRLISVVGAPLTWILLFVIGEGARWIARRRSPPQPMAGATPISPER